MLAKKCDRCGKLYEHDNKARINGFTPIFIDQEGRTARNKDYDLCPDCMDELNKWFEEGANNEHR